ncbi:PREDICTED: MAG2-interacting protein 2 isoform X2 [Nelumbo nucifera]|uniref:MAG2-interacting protein 2 isoform X2 n=1 Tax=Nelumbo nucifera TaxID=4432 RepID=A0A1U8AVW7_NELNU|nr:PREDICTED: MAG2-interacting protein 2 isoform X2 [Nelumbo nucifera]
MEESVIEVLYETRCHASRPFVSNYPPQQLNEGNKGGLLSLIGLSQLKEKWDKYKNPKRLNKLVSLFISPSGEYVAIAVGSQITILQKGDDYKEPCGSFTIDKVAAFRHGAWSESHDVLGVIDEMNVLYFIKSNGEEITRVTKGQLKAPVPIIGLFAENDPGAKSSLCRFNILTSDGALHPIEVSRQPNVSVSSIATSNNHSTLKKHFPQDISCVDFHPELSLLVIVGTTENYRGNSGSYYLSLWRRTMNLDLELLFCSSHFEGFFSAPKGFVGHLTTPKVLMSPKGNYVAVLDLKGGLDIFNLDHQYRSLSVIDLGEKSYSEQTNVPNARNRCFTDVIDFTWWSNHIVILAKRNGALTMIDIPGGIKLLENDPVFSMPVLERAQQSHGHVFILDSIPSNKKYSQVQEENESHGRFDQLDIFKFSWSLMSLSEKSVSEMYNILLSRQEYQAAMNFANRHGLDKDEIFKSQWLQSECGRNEINMFLSNIKDQGFVLSECLDKVGVSEDAVKALLAYGLHITDQYRFSELEDDECSQIWDFRMVRLQLLQFRDRLETFIGINMGRFSVQEYSKFRTVLLNEVAINLAENGKIGALNLLFKRHPYSLAPYLLDILAAIPETVPVQTYAQLLPGRSPTTVSLREKDWVECEKTVSYIKKFTKDQGSAAKIRTEPIVKQCFGFVWPSVDELHMWYKKRSRDIDSSSGQLENCLCMVEFACHKGIVELQQFHDDVSYLHNLIYTNGSDEEINITMNLATWEQLPDYEKFKMMLKGVKDDKIVERLREKAILFMKHRSPAKVSASEGQIIDDQKHSDSFLVRWLIDAASENKLDICFMVIEEGCGDFQTSSFFRDEVEAVECTLKCIYVCTLTDKWNAMDSILSKLPQIRDTHTESLERRIKLAKGHVETGRLLAYYQVPKPMSFFLEASSDEKCVKQILRLILSKFGRRHPGRSDNDWANMWRDMQCFQEKAFPFLDIEYLLTEFCRGLLKAGKFSLARNYLKGTGTVALATERAESLVIQAAKDYFFSASSLACTEIWKAKECLSIFPSSKAVKEEADIIDALTIKLPNLGVTLLPMQFKQISNKMEIIKMAITSQSGAYLNVDELIEIAKLLGLRSQDQIAAVQEAVAREAAVAGDLQLAFDLCLVLARTGHGAIWDLCAAIARGPVLENMEISSRRQLLGFALSHCDEQSVGELLHAWKDLDIQSQCESLIILTGTNPQDVSIQDSSISSVSAHNTEDKVDLRNCSGVVEHTNNEVHFRSIKNMLSTVAKELPIKEWTNWDSFLRENGKILSFAALQLPWLLELSRGVEYGKTSIPSAKNPDAKQYISVRTQAVVCILSWLARNNIAPSDNLIGSLAKSVMEPPFTEDEDILGCSFLLNLVDAFNGVEIIEEQLRSREKYHEICSIMNMGMVYSSLHNASVECRGPIQRRELLLGKFQEKHTPLSSDEIIMIDKEQSTFWREWKSKLEEKKHIADRSRELEQIIPGVETARFLSGDLDYIGSVIFSLIDSVKLERKTILKDVLKLADTYGLNHTKVLLRFLCCVLISEVWANDDVASEISDYKDELLACSADLVNAISSIVYPAIDGRNKQRLGYIYSILSECYLQINGAKEPLSLMHHDSSHTPSVSLSQFYKVLEQECGRVSFIKNLDFKNVAGLGGLNFECFKDEIYNHIDEFNVEALAKMVQTLATVYTNSGCLMTWQDVYKHYVLRLLTSMENRLEMNIHLDKPDNFQSFLIELEQNYDVCRIYIRALSQADALDIMRRYYTLSIPHSGSSMNQSSDLAWFDCLILVLNFWIRMTDDMQEIASQESSLDEIPKFNPECLFKCLKVFVNLVMEEIVLEDQGWATVHSYVNHRLIDVSLFEVFSFCRAMIVSGCEFVAIAAVFSEAVAQYLTSSTLGSDSVCNLDSLQKLPHLYVNILNSLLFDLTTEFLDHKNLHHLLSSLSKLEGDLDDLKSVRYAVWERLVAFSDNMEQQNQVRVYALELMQSIMGRKLKGLSTELLSDVQPWEGWDELHCTTANSETANQGEPNYSDVSNKFTSTLVSLKSTQLAEAISPGIEITPDDLLTIDSAVSCFLNLSKASTTEAHVNALQMILGEWDGIFTIGRHEEDSGEASGAGNNWSTDGWDEGWESFQEEDSVEKEGRKERGISVHPLHICWMELIRKLVMLSRFADVLELMDESISKSNGVLLDEDGAWSMSQLISSMDCFAALKMVLLLPYEAIRLQCLSTVESKLKEGIPNMTSGDYELFVLILSSRTISTIANNSSYSTTFSYVCYLVGHFSHLCQESQLSQIKGGWKERNKSNENDALLLFRRVLFPCFISELVKVNQQFLAGIIVSKFMHTHPSLSLINIAEASLRRYLEGQVHLEQCANSHFEEIGSYRSLRNSVSSLRNKLESVIQSALSCLSTNVK